MVRIDKITRILFMYTQLLDGGKLHKKSFCVEFQIDRRTFDRDVEDIRLFLSESFSGHDLIYDRTTDSYYLDHLFSIQPLSAMEITLILQMFHSSRILRKDEYEGIMDSLLHVSECHRRDYLKKTVIWYKNHYREQAKHALLKLQWDLQECILEKDIIQITFHNQNGKKSFAPVSLHIYHHQIYLFAYEYSKDLQVFPITWIDSFQMNGKKYEKELQEQFFQISSKKLQQILQKVRETNEEN